ncbi:carboxyl-terminal processing protease [Saccharicrinis carchari]|uniref:Carboxyl-terminal processing protease n=1 Tax=Saccharicrinis carchari TaxID=1168039 RepID=A0A521CQQ0_SACCC|nr:S41 family peptidase [Saccharicrinis carchari]SMO61787.1 carboxyl-terminal processing protease [Saccharicrinis carchari]
MSYNNTKSQILGPIVLSVVLIAGIFIGYALLPGKSGTRNPLVIYPKTNKVEAILNLIEEEYVDTVDTKNLEEQIIPELLKKLDPHTVYIPQKDLQNVNEELSSGFGGIGVQFSIQKDTVMVVSVISGGPSEKVGILPGDRIVTVNDSLIAGVGVENSTVLNLLRGDMGTEVSVGIIRRDLKEPLKFDITRGKIPMYSVDVAYMVTDEIGYIKINRFAANTFSEFLTGMAKLKAQGSKKVILDFRGNSGGYLEVAINLCNEFLQAGDMIVYTEGKANPRQEVHANGKGSFQDMEVAVLIDDFSASASEIFAGAVQDNDRGIVVGRRSFGKGLVQNQIPLPDGSALRLTIARYYTPSGRSIQKPYDNGNEEYYMDIMSRFEHGEFFNQDSISINDTLKYTTKEGRTVYGGGGIMPDFFVPRDTTALTPYYYKVRENGLIYRFALEYADNHRDELDQYTEVDKLSAYLDRQALLNQFVQYAGNEGVKMNREQFQVSKNTIEVELKAYIARNVLDNEGFFPILGGIDEVLKEAIARLQEE